MSTDDGAEAAQPANVPPWPRCEWITSHNRFSMWCSKVAGHDGPHQPTYTPHHDGAAPLWDGLIQESMKPGPTMTITKAQYGAILERIREAEGATPRAEGLPVCVCSHAAHRHHPVDGKRDYCERCSCKAYRLAAPRAEGLTAGDPGKIPTEPAADSSKRQAWERSREPRTEEGINWPKSWTADDIAWVKRQILAEAAQGAPRDGLVDDVLLTLDNAFGEDQPDWARDLADRLRAAPRTQSYDVELLAQAISDVAGDGRVFAADREQAAAILARLSGR